MVRMLEAGIPRAKRLSFDTCARSVVFFFSSRRRHTRCSRDWSSDVCSSDLGAVRIEVTGGFEFRSVRIAPDALDPDDVEMLQDLVLAALRDAVDRVEELREIGRASCRERV